MIPRLPVPRDRLPFSDEESSAFARGRRERPLRYLLDSGHLADTPDVRHLFDFKEHEGVELWTIDPADEQPGISIDWSRVVNDHVPLTVWRSDTKIDMAVWPSSTYQTFAKQALQNETSGSASQAYKALILVNAAAQVGLDAFVTDNAFLLARPAGTSGTVPLHPHDALPILGLYLRSRDDFSMSASWSFNRGLFYLVGAWELVPDAWPWYSACVESSQITNDETLRSLGFSLVERLDRALRARDRLHIQLQLHQNNDTSDEALFYLDIFLLQLTAAFDVVARVAHIAFGVSGTAFEAGWRRRRWRERLNRVAPGLASLMADGSEDRDTLDLAALLRNSVHGEALAAFAATQAGRDVESLVSLPQNDTQEFMAAVRRRGGDLHWGVRQVSLVPGGFSLQPGEYVERLLQAGTKSLGRLLRATELERFPGVQGPIVPRPPSSSAFWAPECRQAVRRLAGIP